MEIAAHGCPIVGVADFCRIVVDVADFCQMVVAVDVCFHIEVVLLDDHLHILVVHVPVPVPDRFRIRVAPVRGLFHIVGVVVVVDCFQNEDCRIAAADCHTVVGKTSEEVDCNSFLCKKAFSLTGT